MSAESFAILTNKSNASLAHAGRQLAVVRSGLTRYVSIMPLQDQSV
jgi:hypothetical protein